MSRFNSLSLIAKRILSVIAAFLQPAIQKFAPIYLNKVLPVLKTVMGIAMLFVAIPVAIIGVPLGIITGAVFGIAVGVFYAVLAIAAIFVIVPGLCYWFDCWYYDKRESWLGFFAFLPTFYLGWAKSELEDWQIARRNRLEAKLHKILPE